MACLFRLVLLLLLVASFAVVGEARATTWSVTLGVGGNCSTPTTVTGTTAFATCTSTKTRSQACFPNTIYSTVTITNETSTAATCNVAGVFNGVDSSYSVALVGTVAPDVDSLVCPLLGTSAHRLDVAVKVSQPGASLYDNGGPGLNPTPLYYACERSPLKSGSWCMIGLSFDFAWRKDPLTWVKQGDGVYQGTQCTPVFDGSADGTASAPAGTTTTQVVTSTNTLVISQCPTGQFYGSVNGIETCVKPVSDSGFVSSSTVTGSVTASTSTGTATTVTTTAAQCTGATCSVTTTNITYNSTSSGTSSSTSSVTAEQSKSGYCQSNPSDKTTCGGETGSEFRGSCGTAAAPGAFTCSGDAALCAVAKATNEQNCLLSRDSPEKQEYEASVAAGTSTTGLSSQTIAISAASFDQTNALGVSASCIQDVNVTVSGNAVTLPLSNLCQYLAHLGSLLIAVAFLIAMKIVFRK